MKLIDDEKEASGSCKTFNTNSFKNLKSAEKLQKN